MATATPPIEPNKKRNAIPCSCSHVHRVTDVVRTKLATQFCVMRLSPSHHHAIRAIRKEAISPKNPKEIGINPYTQGWLSCIFLPMSILTDMAKTPKRQSRNRGLTRKITPPRRDRDAIAQQCRDRHAAHPDTARKWIEAMNAARAFLPRCERIKADGLRCGNIGQRTFGLTTCRCHTPAKAQYEADKKRLILIETHSQRVSRPETLRRLNAQRRAVSRRILRYQWKTIGPFIAGSTLDCTYGDTEAIRRLLLQHGVDIICDGFYPATVDNLRWCAFLHLKGRYDAVRFTKRIAHLRAQERRYREKHNDPRKPLPVV